MGCSDLDEHVPEAGATTWAGTPVNAARRATLSSPSRFLLPDGAQSDPSATGTPSVRAASMLAVAPSLLAGRLAASGGLT
jgi:hypothetical protein